MRKFVWIGVMVGLGLMMGCEGAVEPQSPQQEESPTTEADAAATVDAPPPEDPEDAAVPLEKWARCAESFGDALVAPYGRLDGTVLAVVSPGNEACTMPNRSHVVVQVWMNGAAYRMVINVQSNRGEDNRVRVRSLTRPLLGPSFSEGWHTGVSLDYATDLDVHSGEEEWSAEDLPTLVKTIEDAITLDGKVSVYASNSSDRPESAHLIHRNRTDRDGALVIGADQANPRWLLFHFLEQSF